MAQNENKLLLLEKVLILKATNIFADTPENILADIAPLMEDVSYEESANIFREGDIGDCMYIIYKGKVRIHKRDVTLAILHEGDVFGELSLLDSERRSADASAETDALIFRIEQQAFYDLIDNRPEVIRGIVRMLCKRLRDLNEKMTSAK